GELITPARPADALEDAVAHQRLQDRLEMAWRQPMAVGQRLGGNWLATGMQSHIDDGCDRKQAFAGQQRHLYVHGDRRRQVDAGDGTRCLRYSRPMPVEPKPATPRVVSSRWIVSQTVTCTAGAMISCAIRMPRVIANG